MSLYELPLTLQALAPHARSRSCDKNEVILHHGDAAGHLWIIRSGWVKLTRQTPDGKESIIGLCTEGDIFGEAALFPHANYPYHAEALTARTELATVTTEIIRQQVNENPELSNAVMALLSERTSQAQLKLEHMSTMSAAQRLGCFLLRLCQAQTEGSITLQIPVEKHVLAASLGMKPETLSRSQQQLKEAGVTVSGQEVAIRKVESLRDYVCNSCSEFGSGRCEGEAASA